MSIKQVPTVYRAIINDVIENVRTEFDEVGVEEAVLQELLRSWEAKVAQSRVADFTSDPRMGALARQFPMVPFNHASGSGGASGSGATASSKAAAKAKKDAAGKKEGEEEADPKESKDEDEINSDLDDPEEEEDAEDDEAGAGGDLIIALYEKVVRVKNKWKIVLKDGIISVGGRDYLFAKCNGEFDF